MLVENDFLSVGYNPELTVHETASSGNLLCRHDLRLSVAGCGIAQYLPASGQQSVKSAELKLGFTLFQRVRGKLLPTSEAITLSKKRRAFIRTGQPAPAGRQLARDPRAKITLGCLQARVKRCRSW